MTEQFSPLGGDYLFAMLIHYPPGMRAVALSLCLVAAGAACAKTVTVGPGKEYSTPNALWRAVSSDGSLLSPGDIVEIETGTYRGVDATAVWPTDAITVRGVGGEVTLIADGAYVLGKGIFVSAGDEITFEGLTFVGAAVPDGNGAGIRQDGIGMNVRHCTFRDNENGILTNNESTAAPQPYRGRLVVEHCVFEGNGAGDGLTHNIYVGRSARCDFRYNYSTGAVVGHGFKSRADTNVVAYNRISDGAEGTGSRLIDLSDGGLAVVIGNELLQGPNAQNRELIGYGRESLTAREAPHELYVVHNTMVNRRPAGARFVVADARAAAIELLNNVAAGPGLFAETPASRQAGNVIAATLEEAGFADPAADDYGLLETSAAIAAGVALSSVAGFELSPQWVYIHPAASSPRASQGEYPDAGARPYEPPLPVTLVEVLSARRIEGDVELTWRTGEEWSCSLFAIQRAPGADQPAFATVDSVACLGSGTGYRLVDQDAPGGVLLYRLAQFDDDGAVNYGEAVAVDPPSGLHDRADGGIEVAGRTVTNTTTIPVYLELIGYDGRRHSAFALAAGERRRLEVRSPGVYLLRAPGPHRRLARKIAIR